MILKSDLYQIILLQKEALKQKEKGISRQILSSTQPISSFALIITGIRRCGKSTLLNQIMGDVNEDFHYLNFEDSRLANFQYDDFGLLSEILEEQGNFNNLFFDEIQYIVGWERFVRNLLDLGKNVVITGSNASMLSADLGTKLTGRHLDTELFPFSYTEYLDFFKLQPCLESFSDYFKKGGFPEFLKSNQEEVLQHLFIDILHRDIITRYNIRNSNIIKQLALKLLTDIAKPFSFTKLKNTLQIGSVNSVTDYVSYLEDSYLFFTVPKFSYSYQKQVANPKKIFAIDNGLIHANSFQFSDNAGRLLENMVYLELRKTKKDIFYFSEKNECDFVLYDRGQVVALYQVCWELNHENRQREIAGATEAMTFFDKKEAFLLTFNQTDKLISNGLTIHILPVWKWISG